MARKVRQQPNWYQLSAVRRTDGRDYITPEDVGAALDAGADPVTVARDVLAVIGKQAALGVEDAGLCAFIAYRALAARNAASNGEGK